VITNERQYRISKAELRRFAEAIEAHDKRELEPDVDPRIHQAMRDSLESEAEELESQVARYEDLREGRVSERELDSLRDLPIALIEARIAAGLTQGALADRLGLPEQQVQRWEASQYSGVGVERLQEIADALGVEVHETISYAVPA
jgi:ribosome-binding protein aMBF1 (putative translation factor)